MDVGSYFKNLDRVSAPPGFEASVLARLRERNEARLRLRRLSFSLAGATAVVLAAVILLLPIFRKTHPEKADFSFAGQPEKVIAIVEPLNLKNEMRRSEGDYRTVFILEQVSDSMIQQISY
ncbi:MAG: hypothetical protein WBI18_03270 [Candidatus Saccharicenans sp.]